MLKLSRAWGTVTTKATPLPEVWKELTHQDIKFRRGQVCMIAAAPNAGKSMLALIYAIKAGRPTLFFSADTDTATVMLRTAAAISGHSQSTIEKALEKTPKAYDYTMAKADHIQWVFDSSPSLDDIEMEIKAYLELYGIMPELIIIDNLMNVLAESENEWAGLRSIMAELHDMARKTEACVMVLHHVSEATEYGSPEYPPPRRAIHGKVSQLPAMICTLGYDPVNATLRVSAVKNRFGKHSANASEYASFLVNFAACQIDSVTSEMGRMYYRDAQNANRQQ